MRLHSERARRRAPPGPCLRARPAISAAQRGAASSCNPGYRGTGGTFGAGSVSLRSALRIELAAVKIELTQLPIQQRLRTGRQPLPRRGELHRRVAADALRRTRASQSRWREAPRADVPLGAGGAATSPSTSRRGPLLVSQVQSAPRGGCQIIARYLALTFALSGDVRERMPAACPSAARCLYRHAASK